MQHDLMIKCGRVRIVLHGTLYALKKYMGQAIQIPDRERKDRKIKKYIVNLAVEVANSVTF